MEFCNFCKVPIWTIFHRKLLELVGSLFIDQHFSFNVYIFNLIDIRNSAHCPHVSAMGYAEPVLREKKNRTTVINLLKGSQVLQTEGFRFNS